MHRNAIEAIMGLVVIVVAGFFLSMAYATSHWSHSSGYSVKARFARIDGLAVGADVRISGVKVGVVTGQELDPQTYQAFVVMSIDRSVQLPEDTNAKIASEGLMGGKYVALLPGASDNFLKPLSIIKYTQSSVNLEDLIGQFIFSSKDSSDKPKDQLSSTTTSSS